MFLFFFGDHEYHIISQGREGGRTSVEHSAL